MKSSSQFHHFVPQFYLKGWATTVGNRPDRIWIYERGKKPFPGSVKKSAGAENAYAVRKDGADDIRIVEAFLSAQESRAAPVIKKIRNGQPLHPAERTQFAEFLGLMIRRNSHTQANAAVYARGVYPQIIDRLRETAGGLESDERKRVALSFIERLEAEAPEHSRSIGPMAVMEPSRSPRYIAEMDWGFIRDPRGGVLTSDNPFVYDRSRGISDLTNGHIIFPISSSMWFHAMHWTRFHDGHYEMPEAIVANINLRIVASAHRQVYSNRFDPAIEELANKYLGAALANE